MGGVLDPLARTALWTASMRAREHARADRLFEEPLAGLLATEEGPLIMSGFEGDVQGGVQDPALAVRTRYFDDAIRRADTIRGLRQFVFVAAGMDTRAYRLGWSEGSSLFELDRPALLDLKSGLLAQVGAQSGCSVQPVGVDLTGGWTTALAAAGFISSAPTFWLVEGLLYFLTVDERDTLIKEMTALSAPGSWLLADYVTQTSLDSDAMRAWRVKMAVSGHPWQSGCDDPAAMLGGHGWATTVAGYGSPEADFGRWAAAELAPGVSGTRGRYLITATLSGGSASAV
ncbi:SAM-dependent methyltransferase [Actinoplanes sp. NBRC 103695]|uniref:SAM-dependent methyltransferase n=1 Tax=Actinoplanes sp. NBRC 103695 TaxID=3032202 RepID=UPI0024A3F269|nr:SAM-dependent methyltransferase [Actinoplanes sp. NBRC 103695]GLY98783.1 S-adenosyl-L-methionine-dependent methyltransferase [Actinoplanes sp. NBRC 103695]